MIVTSDKGIRRTETWVSAPFRVRRLIKRHSASHEEKERWLEGMTLQSFLQ
jgi:hypothetical protein